MRELKKESQHKDQINRLQEKQIQFMTMLLMQQQKGGQPISKEDQTKLQDLMKASYQEIEEEKRRSSDSNMYEEKSESDVIEESRAKAFQNVKDEDSIEESLPSAAREEESIREDIEASGTKSDNIEESIEA